MEQPMEDVDHPNELAILNLSKSRLVNEQHNYCGNAVDLYQFSHDPNTRWSKGHIFHANNIEDISFQGRVEAADDSNKREAAFLVHGENDQDAVEAMIARSIYMKHDGILKPILAGYNTQIGKVVSAYTVPTLTLHEWLQTQPPSTSIPTHVQDLIRTVYLAIEAMWRAGATSDHLADVSSYLMVDNKIKIDPLRIRDRNQYENDKLLIRDAFGSMILHHIYPIWNDVELLDFIDLLNTQKAWSPSDMLGAPVLLSPARREIMYHNFDKAALRYNQQKFLQENANPEVGWKVKANQVDPVLKKIIDCQVVGFESDYKGAMHFASVVTACYQQHFKKLSQGQWGDNMKGHVDSVLKWVLPRLLTRFYNSCYAA